MAQLESHSQVIARAQVVCCGWSLAMTFAKS